MAHGHNDGRYLLGKLRSSQVVAVYYQEVPVCVQAQTFGLVFFLFTLCLRSGSFHACKCVFGKVIYMIQPSTRWTV